MFIVCRCLNHTNVGRELPKRASRVRRMKVYLSLVYRNSVAQDKDIVHENIYDEARSGSIRSSAIQHKTQLFKN